MRNSFGYLAFPFAWFALSSGWINAEEGVRIFPDDSLGASTLVSDTRVTVQGRFRFEHGKRDGSAESNALTWRNRVGLKTGEVNGFSFLGEIEHVWDLNGRDRYNPYPGPGRTIVADPSNAEWNRLKVRWTPEDGGPIVTVGRQRIALDDQRFVGAVGWRQSEQTYDAVRIETGAAGEWNFNYAYLWRVNRIFGDRAPTSLLEHFSSDSQLFNCRYEGLEAGALTAFAYLLDFDRAAALSSRTLGLRWEGGQDLADGTRFAYDLQWARQSDFGSNTRDYTADFIRVEGGIDWGESTRFRVGHERLGEEDGFSFQVPLGTNHKFNGYADAFLSTPSSGLRDSYIWLGTLLPGDVSARLAYHHFRSDDGSGGLGDEIDATFSRSIGANATALIKAAFLDGDGVRQADITRFSCEINYTL